MYRALSRGVSWRRIRSVRDVSPHPHATATPANRTGAQVGGPETMIYTASVSVNGSGLM
jgi:hypothetical protein